LTPAEKARLGKRIALISIAVSGALAVTKIVVGLMAGSTAVVADGFESAGDLAASAIIYIGLLAGSKPADENHPYGHGRLETISGLLVGMILVAAGALISFSSLQQVGERHEPPAFFGVWPLLASIIIKTVLAAVKFRYGKRIHSGALVADGWNDTVDILSGSAALTALGLTLWNPERFLAADHYGGFAIGLIVVFVGFRVVRDTALQLMDTMPDPDLLAEIRDAALEVPGVDGVEKCYARKTGLQYHVDIHLEVNPDMTVRESHEIAAQARMRICEHLHWVADVLVHVEPSPRGEESSGSAGG
jgi:cation diffusion facilitator family transporter